MFYSVVMNININLIDIKAHFYISVVVNFMAISAKNIFLK